MIPTYGIASDVGPEGHRMYLDFMSVKHWGAPGHWSLNYSAIAYSDDLGQHWTISNVSSPGNSNFGQVAIVRVGSEADPAHSMLYFFGIPGGRFGSVELARVPETEILDQSAYQYYAGSAGGGPVWKSNEAAAVPVVPAPSGELSVMWVGDKVSGTVSTLPVCLQVENDHFRSEIDCLHRIALRFLAPDPPHLVNAFVACW